MRNLIMAILERDPLYGNRLCSYMLHHEDSPFEVQLYLEHPVDGALLAGADVILDGVDDDTLYPSLPGERVIRLTAIPVSEDIGGRFYKYQSADRLYQKALQLLLDRGCRIGSRGGRQECRIIGLMLPCPGEAAFVKLGQLLEGSGDGAPALYLPLHCLSALSYLRPQETEQTAEGMSDLIYLVKQRKENLASRISVMARGDDFRALLPALTPEETGEMTAEDWHFLTDQLRCSGDYERIYMDAGGSFLPAALAGLCDECRIIAGEDPLSRQLAARAEQLLEHMTGGQA